MLVPLYFSFTTYFFFRGNSDAYDYVDTYLKQSKVIKLTIPKLYEEKRERYKFRDGRKGVRDYRQFIFYIYNYQATIIAYANTI